MILAARITIPIAALFLATGAAHTEPLAAYGDPQAILPPPEYDYYPPGGFRVLTVPTHSELVRMWGRGLGFLH
jgi:hypothetical protein